MWTLKGSEQICVNEIKRRNFLSEVLDDTYSKLEEKVYVNKKGKKSFDESPLVM